MVRFIVAAGVRFRILVIAAAVIIAGLGIAQLRGAPVDEYPEFAQTQVEIQAEALGLSAAEVEQLITVPLEQDLLNGVPWLSRIRSTSVAGLSTIDMTFNSGTKLLQARQMVQEHLTQAHALPQVGTPPVMVPPESSTGRVLMVGLGAKDLSLVDMSILARWKIKPRLEGLPGVASVSIWGQRDRQLQVLVDPDKLRQYGVTLDQIVETTGNSLWVSPLTFIEASTPGTGGFVDTTNQRFSIQHVTPVTTAKSLSAVTVQDTGGRILTLGQVANVVEDHQPLIGDAIVGDAPGLMLVVQKLPGANARDVTREVERALDDMRPGLSGVTIDTSVYRPASYLDSALHNLAVRGIIVLLLIALLLGILLLSWRIALIGVAATAFSMITAAYLLHLLHTSFNVMVLAGLTAALGTVVADAVLDATRIGARRVSAEHDADAADDSEAVVAASSAVRSPLAYASLIAVLLPLPAVALEGVAGRFARAFLVPYVVAVVVSTVSALLVVPALCSVSGAERRVRPSPVARLITRGFDALAPRVVAVPRAAYALLAVFVVAALAIAPQLMSHKSALPTLQDRNLSIQWEAAAGTSLTEMTRITEAAVRELRALPGVSDVGAHVGRAILGDQPVEVNSAELWVNLNSTIDYARAVAAVRRTMSQYPGTRASVSTYPADQVAGVVQHASGPVDVRVYGYDLTTLQEKARDVQQLLSGVRGVSDPTVEAVPMEPSLQVEVNLLAAQKYGITPGDVRRASATYFAGLPVGSLYEDQKIFDVVVWGSPQSRHTPGELANLVLDTPSGGHVRLSSVASVTIGPAPTAYLHDNISRSLDVTAQVHGRDVSAVLNDVKHRIAAMPMPSEFHAEVLSSQTPYTAEHWRMAAVALGVGAAIVLLLQAALQLWRLAALVFVLVPVGAVGGLLTGAAVGGVRTVGVLAGLLAVLGVMARNGLLLVRSYEDAAADEPVVQRVLAVTRAHAVPIVMTAVLLATAALPFTFWSGVAGTEVIHPLAVTLLGGLVTSTACSLVLLPALYVRIAGRR